MSGATDRIKRERVEPYTINHGSGIGGMTPKEISDSALVKQVQMIKCSNVLTNGGTNAIIRKAVATRWWYLRHTLENTIDPSCPRVRIVVLLPVHTIIRQTL